MIIKDSYFLYLILFICLLTGCTTPSITVPQLNDELKTTQEIKNDYIIQDTWWEAYNNTELNSLIDKALKNNPDYLKAALTMQKELYQLNLATSDLFPTLSGTLSASSQKDLNKTYDSNNNFSGEIGLNYELDLYGKIRDAQSAQEFEYKATVQDKETARLTLINSVIDLYFNLEYLQNVIDLTHQDIKAYQDIEKIMQEKYESGKVAPLEYVQAKQSRISEQSRLLEYETQFKEMEQSLKNILNMRPDEELSLKYGSILEQKTLTVDIDVPLSVLANRPDLIASQLRLEKAFKLLTAEEKNWYPNISLKGAFGSSSSKSRTTFDFPFVLGSISLDLPFLDWNRVKNNVKISEADYQIALLDFKDTLTQALNEVVYYYTADEKTMGIFENTQKNIKNSREITEYYEIRYNNGKAEFKDLLEAIHTENATRKDYVQQKYQIIKYENYIYKAMNGRYIKK